MVVFSIIGSWALVLLGLADNKEDVLVLGESSVILAPVEQRWRQHCRFWRPIVTVPHVAMTGNRRIAESPNSCVSGMHSSLDFRIWRSYALSWGSDELLGCI